MEKKRVLHILQIIAFVIQVLAAALACVVVLRLDILPGMYLAVVIAAMAIILGCTCMFMFFKIAGDVAPWRRIVTCIFALLFACGCLLVSKLAMDAFSLFDKPSDDANVRSCYVLVLNENTAKTLSDAKDYTFGAIADYDEEHTNLVLDEIEKETASIAVVKYYAQAPALVNALYSKEVDAIVMNGVSVSLLVEQEGYEDFLSRVRILYTLDYRTDDAGKNENKQQVAETPFVVYISGSDTRSLKLNVSRSDVNILAVVNPKTKQVLLLNTPRDYFIPNPAGKGVLDKLTHCGMYGVDCSMEALGDLYGIDVTHYGKINFYGFEALIDAIGGVTVYADHGFTANGRTYIQKGENTLNGAQALDFARERYNVSGGDNGRGRNQMKVITAVIQKLSSSTTIISKYSDILKSLEGMFVTDFTSEEISSLVKMQLRDAASWNVQSFAVTGSGDMQETYSAPGQKLWVMRPNTDVVAYASTLVGKVMNGETLTADDMVMPKK